MLLCCYVINDILYEKKALNVEFNIPFYHLLDYHNKHFAVILPPGTFQGNGMPFAVNIFKCLWSRIRLTTAIELLELVTVTVKKFKVLNSNSVFHRKKYL